MCLITSLELSFSCFDVAKCSSAKMQVKSEVAERRATCTSIPVVAIYVIEGYDIRSRGGWLGCYQPAFAGADNTGDSRSVRWSSSLPLGASNATVVTT
jgi:hypothetical protein